MEQHCSKRNLLCAVCQMFWVTEQLQRIIDYSIPPNCCHWSCWLLQYIPCHSFIFLKEFKLLFQMHSSSHGRLYCIWTLSANLWQQYFEYSLAHTMVDQVEHYFCDVRCLLQEKEWSQVTATTSIPGQTWTHSGSRNCQRSKRPIKNENILHTSGKFPLVCIFLLSFYTKCTHSYNFSCSWVYYLRTLFYMLCILYHIMCYCI